MSNHFSLLSLHDNADIHPRTWICLRGVNLRKAVNTLEQLTLAKHSLTREALSREVAEKFNCSKGVIKRILQGNSRYYPIPVLLELLHKSGRGRIYSRVVETQTEFLKVNSASSKEVIALKSLTPALAKIIGAFMADGSLNKNHYNIELTEEYEDSVRAFIKWFEDAFGVKPTNFGRKKNAYRVVFSHKIIVRYFIRFFNISPGPKTFTAHEPVRIQKSPLSIRKFFALGALMFDGCVTKSGRITFCVKSENLHKAIRDIWGNDNITFGVSTTKRGEFIIFTTENNRKGKYFKYFEPNTQKYKLLQWLKGIDSKPIVKEGHVSTAKLLDVITTAKSCDIGFLEKIFNRRYTTIRYYLHILEAQNKVRTSRKPGFISDKISDRSCIILSKKSHDFLFESVRKQFIKDKIVSEIIQVKKGTFSSWRRRKTGIPIYHILEMCKILNINQDFVLRSPFHIDRDVVELS